MSEFQNSPENQSSPVNRPVSFVYRGEADCVRIKIELLNHGTLEVLATYYEDSFKESGSGEPFFNIDVSKPLAKSLYPKPSARTPLFSSDVSTPYNTHFINTTRFFLKVYELTEVNGLIVTPSTATLSSSIWRAVNTIWQDEEGSEILEEFYQGTRKPLVDHLTVDLYLDESYQLVFFRDASIDLVYTVTKFTNGVQVGSPQSITVPRDPDADTFSIAIGTRDLNIDSSTDYYVIQAPGTDPFTVFVKGEVCKDKTMRLHWLNQRGGYDAYTFNARKIRELDVESKKQLRPIVWDISSATPHAKGQKGLIKLQIDQFESYEIISRLELEEDDLLWIKGVFSSSEVYVELPELSHLVPVFVENKDSVVVDDTNKVSLQVAAKLTVGTRIISHSN